MQKEKPALIVAISRRVYSELGKICLMNLATIQVRCKDNN